MSDLIVPHPRRISLATMYLQELYGDDRALELAAETGCDAVDFDTSSIRWNPDRCPDSIYAKSDDAIMARALHLKHKAESLGLVIAQTHGRGEAYLSDDVIERGRKDLLFASVLGAPVTVMHGISSREVTPHCDPAVIRQQNFELFTRLLPYAKKYGVRLATETFGAIRYEGEWYCDFFGGMREFLMSYNRICAVGDFADWFRICVDTGHSNCSGSFNGNPTPGDAIRLAGRHLAAVHLNDNLGLEDLHRLPLGGTVDWDDVLNALDEVGFSGYYNLELNLLALGREFAPEMAAYAVKSMQKLLRRHEKQKHGNNKA